MEMWFSFLEDLENKTPKKETPAPVMNNSCSVGHSARILREKGILESSIEIDHGWSLCFSSFVFFFALKKKVYNNPKIIKLSTQWGDFFFFFFFATGMNSQVNWDAYTDNSPDI